MSWNPAEYLTFEDQRLRPALDLLARIPLENPGQIVDLGCGTGNVTRLLQTRWPDARITGIDNAPEMLEKARQIGQIEWTEADAVTWEPTQEPDLIFSNAALHWIKNHEGLFSRLMGFLKPGGVLAVQMPQNDDAPSHTLIREVAVSGPWREKLAPLVGKKDVLEPARYYELLATNADTQDIWETEYLQVLSGENPVADWTRGTTLVPVLNALDEGERQAFEAEYRKRIRQAYPVQRDGTTLFPFKRLFIAARKKYL